MVNVLGWLSRVGGGVLELPRKVIQLDLNNTKAEKGRGFPEISRYELQSVAG